MQLSVVSRPAAEIPADLLAIPLPSLDPADFRLPPSARALDRASGGRIRGVLETGDFRGKAGEVLLLYGDEGVASARVLLVGLGDEAELDGQALRRAAAIAVSEAARRRGSRVALLAPRTRRLPADEIAQALAEGAVLGSYRFDRYQTAKTKTPELGTVTITLGGSGDLRAARTGMGRGRAIAESQNLARDLSNEPPNALPPAALARAAQRMAKEVGLRCRVLAVDALEKRGLGAMLAVGGGSSNPPRLVVLEHNAPPRGKSQGRRRPTVCLVGKGVTFDSGGLSLKPSASMVTMKHDMSGAATVVGVMRAAALLKLPLHIVGVIGAVENMPSGTAYRPDDIVTTGSGKTVEIGNTDAEGRLVLADCLHFAKTEFAPAAMVDLATLTGACAVALGTWAAAVLSNHEGLGAAIARAGEATGERFWPLPLWKVHREHMRSKIADVRQTGGRDGGTITAAAFLWHFAGDDVPWAHLDIASTANTDKAGPLQPAGATGFGVRAVTELLRSWGQLGL